MRPSSRPRDFFESVLPRSWRRSPRRLHGDPPPSTRPRPARVVLSLVLLAASVVVGERFLEDVLEQNTHRSGGTALSDYLDAGELLETRDVYALNYSYPPAFAVAMMPLAALPRPAAAVVWYVLQLGCLAGVFLVARRILEHERVRRPALALGVAFALSGRFLFNNLTHGNVNAALLLLALAAVLALQRGRPVAAGSALAAAASIKLLPLFFLGVLVVQRRVRAAVAMVAALVVLNALVPAAVLGPERALAVSRGFWDKMVAPYAASAVASFDERNLALSAALERHFVDDPAARTTSLLGLRALDPESGRTFVLGVLVAIALVTLWAVRRRRAAPNDRSLLRDFALALLVLLLVSPKTWKAHYALLFAPALVFAVELLDARVRTPRRLFACALFALAALPLLASSRGVVGRELSNVLRDASVEPACVLVLWLALVVAGRARPARAPAAVEQEQPPGSALAKSA